MRRELEYYTVWFNIYRPHQALDGLTPAKLMDPKNRKRRQTNAGDAIRHFSR